MTLKDAVSYFTEETHIMPCMAAACGTAGEHLSVMGDTAECRIRADSLFDAASLTKLFTGLAVMRLHEEGLLDLTAPVTAYAPVYRNLSGATVDQVLGFEIGLTTPQRIDTQKTPADGLAQLHQVQMGPVTGRAYSDMHAMVLHDVIEGAAQSTYEAVLARIILTPLGMADTFCRVPDEERVRCIPFAREHRIERGQHILREGAGPGIPHDPKAQLLWPACPGHAGVFSTLADLTRLCQGLLRGDVISRSALIDMSRNRTGHRRPDGSWQQFLGAQCYVKHPEQFFSEIPVYESDKAIGLSGFTGHHLSVDPETGVFALMLGNRVLNRLTVVLPADQNTRVSLGLSPDGTGCIRWPDGHPVWSSVDYVHHKDAHFHQAVANELGLRPWRKAGTAWP